MAKRRKKSVEPKKTASLTAEGFTITVKRIVPKKLAAEDAGLVRFPSFLDVDFGFLGKRRK